MLQCLCVETSLEFCDELRNCRDLCLSLAILNSFRMQERPKGKDGFKGERSGWSPQDLHKTEVKSGNVIETFVSLKLRNVNLYF